MPWPKPLIAFTTNTGQSTSCDRRANGFWFSKSYQDPNFGRFPDRPSLFKLISHSLFGAGRKRWGLGGSRTLRTHSRRFSACLKPVNNQIWGERDRAGDRHPLCELASGAAEAAPTPTIYDSRPAPKPHIKNLSTNKTICSHYLKMISFSAN